VAVDRGAAPAKAKARTRDDAAGEEFNVEGARYRA